MGEGRLWVSDMGDAPSLLQTSHSLTLIVSGSPIWSPYLGLTNVRERGLSASRAAQYLGEPQVASRTVREISGMHTWRYLRHLLRAGPCHTHSECSSILGSYCLG